MQTMKYKFKRIFIIPACWYHSAMITLVPFVTGSRFVDKMVTPMAPKPQPPEPLLRPDDAKALMTYEMNLDKYWEKLKESQGALLAAWHKDVNHQSEYRIWYNGDGHYVIAVETTLSGSRRFIAPFKQQWPVSDMTLMN